MITEKKLKAFIKSLKQSIKKTHWQSDWIGSITLQSIQIDPRNLRGKNSGKKKERKKDQFPMGKLKGTAASWLTAIFMDASLLRFRTLTSTPHVVFPKFILLTLLTHILTLRGFVVAKSKPELKATHHSLPVCVMLKADESCPCSW